MRITKHLIFTACFLLLTENGFAQVLSNIAYKPISVAQEAMSTEDFTSAIQTLDNLLNKGDKLKPFDKAKALQLIAISNINLENIPAAITTSEQAIATNALDSASSSQLRFTLFNLYSMQEDYKSAIHHLKIWFQLEPTPTVQAFFSAARVYALAEQWDSALEYANEGLALSKLSTQESTQSISPQSSWYNLLVAIQLQLQLFEDARDTLEAAINLWPDNAEYYRQLSGIYQELEQGKYSFVILSLAYQNNLLSTTNDYERLSQQYRFLGNPYKGAEIYKTAFDKKLLKDDEKYWSTLSDTFLQAREWRQAQNSLTKAAKLSSTGRHWLTLCKTSFQDERWDQSLVLCKNALEKGGLEKTTSEAWQFIALAKFRQNDLTGAMSAFDRCLEYDNHNSRCRTWHEHTQRIQIEEREEQKEIAKQKELKKEKQDALNKQLDRALQIGDELSL